MLYSALKKRYKKLRTSTYRVCIYHNYNKNNAATEKKFMMRDKAFAIIKRTKAKAE